MTAAVTLALGMRYAFSRRSSLSLITLVAVGGLALSVTVLVVVISVINGFERELRVRVFGVLPHLSVIGRAPLAPRPEDQQRLAAIPGVAGVAPFVQGTGLVAVADRVSGVRISGIDPGQQSAVSAYADFLVPARPPAELLVAGAYQIVLGAVLARQLDVSVGDRVTLVLPAATVTPAGLFPRQKRFTVTALLRSQSEVDATAAFVHIADAERLFRLGGNIHGYELRLDDLFAADEVASTALALLNRNRVVTRSWMQTHGNLYHAIAMQKSTMFVLLSFLIAVAAFNLVSTLVMVVNQRSSDVAILRTLGSDTRTVVGAFVLLGLALGGAGVGIGSLAGVAISELLPALYLWVTGAFGLELMSQYFVSYLPVEVLGSDMLGIVITALVLCVLSTLYPAWRAAALKPSQVLAHE
ncbi:MAG: lipoprotein-releasing ABC transporter permease subunit [Pseudomonadales bacterium]